MKGLNYIVKYDRRDGANDFDRFSGCSRKHLHKLLAELFELPVYRNQIVRYHIWKADEDCYETVGDVPIESGGVDSLLAQYGE